MELLEQVQEWMEEIGEAEDDIAFNKGKQEAKEEEMKSKFGVKSVKQAKALVVSLSKEIETLNIKIDSSIGELEEKFEAIGDNNE